MTPVRLLTALASPDGSWDEGDVYLCDDDTAIRLIRSGQAVPCAHAGVEVALEAAPPEMAVARKGRLRRA